MKRLFVVLIVLGLMYAGGEVAAVAYAENRLAEAAASRDPLAKDANAEVSFPFLFHLMTKSAVERVELEVAHVNVGPFLADRLSLLLEGVHLNRPESLQRREPVVEAIDRVEASIHISSAEASKVLPKGFRFEFSDGAAKLLGPNVQVPIEFRLGGPSEIAFASASGDRLPSGVPNSWEFAKVPFVACLEGVSVEDDLLVVTCSQENPPGGFPPDVGG
jgi:hypothetical protein